MRFNRTNLLALTSALSLTATAVLANPSYATNGLFNRQSNRVPAKQTRVAQVFRTTINLPAGQQLSTKLFSKDTLYVQNGETKAAKLRVYQDVYGNNGVVLIPAGAIIDGEFVPVSGGSKFIARTISMRNVTVSFGAESALINDVKDPREANMGSILTDAAIGAAGGAILGGVIGDRVISTEKILGGAAAGVIVGNVTAPQVTVIDPNNLLTVTTTRNTTFRTGGD